MQHALHTRESKESDKQPRVYGLISHILLRLFRLVDKPWKMYPLGFVFGLRFDTSLEVALLGIAGIQAASGTSLWLVLNFLVLFTAGMCLIDTIDGALMFAAYSSTALAADDISILYYSIVLTSICVVAAIVIGVIQLLSLLQNILQPHGEFGWVFMRKLH